MGAIEIIGIDCRRQAADILAGTDIELPSAVGGAAAQTDYIGLALCFSVIDQGVTFPTFQVKPFEREPEFFAP